MALNRSYAPTRHQIKFRFRARNRWLFGCVKTTRRRLADLLNSDEGNTIVVADDVGVLDVVGDQGSRAIGHVNISTSTILFAIPVEDEPHRPDIPIRSTRKLERVVVGVGPYEIEGTLFLLPEARPRDVLMSVASPFIVIAEAVIRLAGDSSFVEEHGAVLVNRQHVDFIGLAPEASSHQPI